MRFNVLLLDYALKALYKRSKKHFFIFFILSVLIFLLASILLISESIKHELMSTLKTLPSITVQRFIAGKQTDVPLVRQEALLAIEGVSAVTPRVWGYYYFKPAGVNFSVVGIDAYEEQYSPTLERITQQYNFNVLKEQKGMIVGSGVKKILEENYYNDFFHFIAPNGTWQKVAIAGVFHSDLNLETNDLIILPKSLAYAIFGMDTRVATDMVIRVANTKEVATIARKITEIYPDMRAITQEDIRISYQNIFDYKSGFFLALFSVCAFAFFIIIFDQSSGLHAHERKEIGILKALGWSSDDILQEKFYESCILSFGAFLVGVCGALFFVYGLNAPLLRSIFMGYSALKPSFVLPFHVDSAMMILLFLLSVPLYIAATLIPAWRISTLDTDEVMR